jgi:ribosomal protein S18 acetylase RimI-like enzyme
MMEIVQVTQVSEDLVSAFERLIPQLSSSISPPTRAELVEIVSSPAVVIFIAKDPARSGEVVGAFTLVVYRVPTGLHAWIEDVVVSSEHRRRGIGTALTKVALEYARDRGARSVDLTSRPSREAANRLYRRLGFKQRETNVYRFEFE